MTSTLLYGLKPVSYTHLDVYKRQWFKRVSSTRALHLDSLTMLGLSLIHI